jgi:4'-phosphopantetheinyl transferase
MSASVFIDPPTGCSHAPAEINVDDLRSRPNDVDVWCASLDGHSSAAMCQMESLLSSDELARARRFYFDRDRRRYVAGRGILRRLIGRYLDRAPEKIKFTYGPYGKPTIALDDLFLRDNQLATPIHFNVAHSEGLAVYALTCAGEVGIDVEFKRAVPDWKAVADAMFSASELKRLRVCPAERRRDEFFQGWTRQEAALKAGGIGLGGVTVPGSGSVYNVYPLHPAPGYTGALAVVPAAQWATLQWWPREAQSNPCPRAKAGEKKRIRLVDLSAGETHFL